MCLYGGQPIDKQILQLKKAPQIVVATPGRLMDHVKRRTIRLDDIRKNTGNEIRAVRFNEAGELEEVGGNG